MNCMQKQMMKSAQKYRDEIIMMLSEKYNFPGTEGIAYINEKESIEEEKVRGRPEKKKKTVVNKTEMVEDVIKTIMMKEDKGTLSPITIMSDETTTTTTTNEKAEVSIIKEKKKRAPAKKKADALVTETVVQAETDKETVAVVTEIKEKKKRAPAKKKADAPVTETVIVAEKVTEELKEEKIIEEIIEHIPEAEIITKQDAEEEEEIELDAEEFQHNGVDYLLGPDDIVYDAETYSVVGRWGGNEKGVVPL